MNHIFSVTRSENTSIHMACSGTSNGLNGVFWDPCFILPTLSTHFQAVQDGTHMDNIYIGKKLNCIIHKSVWVHCGVDISNFRSYYPNFSGW